MIKALVISAMLMVGVSAQANWSGEWSGQATYTNDAGDSDSGNMSARIGQTDSALTFFESVFEMDYNFSIKNGALFLDETQVGTVTDDALSVKFAFTDSEGIECTQVYTMSKGETGAIYIDDFRCTDGYFDRIDGILTVK